MNLDEFRTLAEDASAQAARCWCGAPTVETEGGYRWYCATHRPRCRSGAHAAGSCHCAGDTRRIPSHFEMAAAVRVLCGEVERLRKAVRKEAEEIFPAGSKPWPFGGQSERFVIAERLRALLVVVLLLIVAGVAGCKRTPERPLSQAKSTSMRLLSEPTLCEGDAAEGWTCIGTRTGRMVDCLPPPESCKVTVVQGFEAPAAEVSKP